MAELITRLEAAKQTIPPAALMHPDAGGPTPNKGFEQAHSNKRLAKLKNGSKLLIPKGLLTASPKVLIDFCYLSRLGNWR